MKLSKFVLALVFLFGLNVGTVSADTISPGGDTLLDIFNITASQTDGDSLGQDITANTPFSHWYGIDVNAALANGGAVDTKSSGSQTAVATNTTNIAIYNATEAAGVWTVGSLVGFEAPATGANQLLATLLAGQKYLLRFYGTLLYDNVIGGTQTAQYQFSLDSTVVPVPAAIWLFGTAIAGFLGLRRKGKLGAVAA